MIRSEGFRWVPSAFAALYSIAVTSSGQVAASAAAEEKWCYRDPMGEVVGGEEEKGKADAGDGRFAPRFDGLRFIETLVTAHR